MTGADVTFVSGSDDHGVAIMISAAKEGKTPAELAKFYHASQQSSFRALGITFDVYGSTSQNKFHAETSQRFFTQMFEKGFFEKKSSRQFYDENRKQFLPDRFVKGTCGYCNTPDQSGDQCEQCGKMLDVDTLHNARSTLSETPATIRDTVHWFLDLSRCEGVVRDWLATANVRDFTRTYVEGLISTGLVKRSMTRDIDWGIPVPLADPDAKGKVLYVWFDAPIGYISNTMQLAESKGLPPSAGEALWKDEDVEIFHFIGEDNTIFHCVIWIAMLSALGTYRLPKGVIVNQYLNFQRPGSDVEKMSKSRGTAVFIDDYLAEGGTVDGLRYYLTMVAPERARSVFNPEDLIQRYNSELANVLGNFVNRVISFTYKNIAPAVPAPHPASYDQFDQEFAALRPTVAARVGEHLERCEFRAALEAVMEFARACNKYIDDKKPWATRKTNLEVTGTTLFEGLQAIALLGVLLMPFLPETGSKILAMLSIDPASVRWDDGVRGVPVGQTLKEPVILFAKIEKAPTE
jgi:methionyl-tRNA synthetase